MPSFEEISTRLNVLRFKRAILLRLIDFLETDFRTPTGSPKRVILTEDKLRVPDDAIHSVIQSLFTELRDLEVEKNLISQSEVISPTPTTPPETP
jgi:hypothetical protein